MSTSPAAGTLTALRVGAIITAVLTVVQPILYLVASLGQVRGVMRVHGIIGDVTLLVALFAAVSAFLWMRRGGAKGLFFHALGLAVLSLIQVGLGEMANMFARGSGGREAIRIVHMGLGVLLLVGAIALVTLAIRKPISTTTTAPSA